MRGMQTSQATVPTSHGGRYLHQLAKHWGHKFPVETHENTATIDLPLGRCALDADSAELRVSLTGAEGADMARFQQVVADHLQRFGFRETLTFDWR